MSAPRTLTASERRAGRGSPCCGCEIVDRPAADRCAANRELASLLLNRFFCPHAPALARIRLQPETGAKSYYVANRNGVPTAPSLAVIVAHVSDPSRRASANGEALFPQELGVYATAPPSPIRLVRDEDRHVHAPDLASPIAGVSKFLAWDVDGASFPGAAATAKRLLAVLSVHGAHGLLERSRGGNGAHAWLLLDSPAPSNLCRAVARAIAMEAQIPLRRASKSGSEVDATYPAQATISADSPLGNLIALPLAAEPRSRACSVFVDLDTLEPLTDQLAALRDAPRASASWLAALAHEWKLDLDATDPNNDDSAALAALGDEQRTAVRAARRRGPLDASGRAPLTPGELDAADTAWLATHPAAAKLLEPATERLANRHTRDFYLALIVLRSGGDAGLAARLLLAAPDSKAAATDGDGGHKYLERTIARAAAIVASEPRITVLADGNLWIGDPSATPHAATPPPSWDPDDDRASASADDEPTSVPRSATVVPRRTSGGPLRDHTKAEVAHLAALGIAVEESHHHASRRLRRASACCKALKTDSCGKCLVPERTGHVACEDALEPRCTRVRWALRSDVLLSTWPLRAAVARFPLDPGDPIGSLRRLLARMRRRDKRKRDPVCFPATYRWLLGNLCMILLAPEDEIATLMHCAAAENVQAEVKSRQQIVSLVGRAWLAPAIARRALVAEAVNAIDRGNLDCARAVDARILAFPFNSPHVVRTRGNAAGEVAFPWPSDLSIRKLAVAEARKRRGLDPEAKNVSSCCGERFLYSYSSAATGRPLLPGPSLRPLAKKDLFNLIDALEPPPPLDPRLTPMPPPSPAAAIAAQEGGAASPT